MLGERDCVIEHVDATVVLEQPKLLPHRLTIRDRLAEALGVDGSRLNVKATRGEGMGFVGRLEGAAALAIATITRPDRPAPNV
jgi:2-C-methyl-D-erythritol 2,4-cyclodiphosphate synthase